MTSLTHSKLQLPACAFPKESTLPFLRAMSNVQQQTKTILEEDDELFIGYGFVRNCFPHVEQNDYDQTLTEQSIPTVVLENAHLRAEFIPSLGGRLWSLFDKDAGRDLLFKNPVFRPGNLAVRNAWFSGGVEWNIGIVGHHPYTCAPLYSATLTRSDGTPVLRMYEFDRIRRVVYQMDFFLPEDSRLLYCRMRIQNPNAHVVPMYWWSNIAVPELPDGRVITPAYDTYTNRDNMVSKTTVPISGGIDITYPTNNPHAIDFFFHLQKEKRKFVCQVDKDGYGLLQCSTDRLKGRKLFVWGQGPGGDRWQKLLAGERNDCRYAEIQAGLASTQYECLPMPPKTVWEWLEGYGAVKADASRVHGDWKDSVKELETRLEDTISRERLETLLKETRTDIALKKADHVFLSGSPWGVLDNVLRASVGENPLPEHLQFAEQAEQLAPWISLLREGTCGVQDATKAPVSYQAGAQWLLLLEKAVQQADRDNWFTHYMLACAYFADGRFELAEKHANLSAGITPSAWVNYLLALLAKLKADGEKTVSHALEAVKLAPNDKFVAMEAVDLLLWAEDYLGVKTLVASLPADMQKLGRVQLSLLRACLKRRELAEAKTAFAYAQTIADIREGENSITELWYALEALKCEEMGLPFDRNSVSPPTDLDYRMSAVKK